MRWNDIRSGLPTSVASALFQLPEANCFQYSNGVAVKFGIFSDTPPQDTSGSPFLPKLIWSLWISNLIQSQIIRMPSATLSLVRLGTCRKFDVRIVCLA